MQGSWDSGTGLSHIQTNQTTYGWQNFRRKYRSVYFWPWDCDEVIRQKQRWGKVGKFTKIQCVPLHEHAAMCMQPMPPTAVCLKWLWWNGTTHELLRALGLSNLWGVGPWRVFTGALCVSAACHAPQEQTTPRLGRVSLWRYSAGVGSSWHPWHIKPARDPGVPQVVPYPASIPPELCVVKDQVFCLVCFLFFVFHVYRFFF